MQSMQRVQQYQCNSIQKQQQGVPQGEKVNMQAKSKQQILKLLDLDLMITEYLAEPKLNRKTPAANHKQKVKNSNTISGSFSKDKLSQKLVTVDVPFTKSRNICSANNITSKTIDGNPCGGRFGSLPKSYSNKIANNTKSNGQSKNKQLVYNSVKIFKKPIQFRAEQIQSSGKNTTSRLSQRKKICQNQSTKINTNTNYNIQTDNDNVNADAEVNQSLNIDAFKEKTGIAKIHMTKTNRQKIKLRGPISRFRIDDTFDIIGELFKGRYQIEKVIGRGLSGKVYKAKDILSDRFVAVKILDPNNIQYQFIKQLQHSNMICYYNSFTQNNKRYLILQYLPHSLSQIVRKRKLTEPQVRKIFKSISSGLMYLHSLSYAHRDIKLDNFVCNQDFSIVKFIDFGLCVDTASVDLKEKGRFCGTTSYMAPEVISGKCSDPKKADIWSLGVALYILSVGRNPFLGKQQLQIFNKIKSNKTLFPNQMCQSLKSLLSSMLSKNPEDRPSIFQVVNSNWLTQQ